MLILNESQIQKALHNLGNWDYDGHGAIGAAFEFPDFIVAMEFVNRVAQLAEELGHHPDILIRYNKVIISSTTHDVGGVTELDFRLAREIERI
jgi:4a-hydroxytetrahydrobiopterin dehydratase